MGVCKIILVSPKLEHRFTLKGESILVLSSPAVGRMVLWGRPNGKLFHRFSNPTHVSSLASGQSPPRRNPFKSTFWKYMTKGVLAASECDIYKSYHFALTGILVGFISTVTI